MVAVSIPRRKNPRITELRVPTGTGRPMLFEVTGVGALQPLWPYALALHVNPGTLTEAFAKSKNVVTTQGGFVEFIWPDELDSLSAQASTGAFIGPDTGLAADGADSSTLMQAGSYVKRTNFNGRHGTMAWERQEDLKDLFRCNGQVYNGRGQPVLRGQVICMYDRGIYVGYFTSFEITEDSDHPFSFQLTWEFKIMRTVYELPLSTEPYTLSDFAPATVSPTVINPVATTPVASAPAPTNSSQANDINPETLTKPATNVAPSFNFDPTFSSGVK